MRGLTWSWGRMIGLATASKLIVFALVAVGCTPISAQSLICSVKGIVVDREGQPLPRAVVQIEDLRSLQIRSFVTRDDGSYFFSDLSCDIDYKLSARYRRVWGSAKTLSAYDSRKVAVINLKVDVKKEE